MSGTTQYGIKLFSDGANTKEMLAAINDGVVSGFTTNPTLMRKAGVANYEEFAKSMRDAIPKEYSISYEVISDELKEMGRQARKISSWGENIYVKIPITNTKGVSTTPLIEELSNDGLMLNITAILTIDQVIAVSKALSHDTPSIVSYFAGRAANAGVDPMEVAREMVKIMSSNPLSEVLWASPREVLNVRQAAESGCHIITITPDIQKQLALFGKDLTQYSLETVQMFYDDAKASGYTL